MLVALFFFAQGEGLGAIMAVMYVLLLGFGMNTWLGFFKLSRGERALGTVYLIVAAVICLFFFSLKAPYGG